MDYQKKKAKERVYLNYYFLTLIYYEIHIFLMQYWNECGVVV